MIKNLMFMFVAMAAFSMPAIAALSKPAAQAGQIAAADTAPVVKSVPAKKAQKSVSKDIGEVNVLAASKKNKEADEAKVLAAFKKKYPSTQISSLTKSEVDGLYEVTMGTNVAYTDTSIKYLIFGHVFDMTTQTDLTQARIDERSKIDFSALPFEKAIKVVKGDGARVFAVFTDPDCPYCKRLDETLDKDVDNYTMYVFMFPIAGLHPDAESHSNAIWCAKDRVIAWHDYMLAGKIPEGKADCVTPIKDVITLGQGFGVQGTPTLFRVDGARVPGALAGPQLNAWLSGQKLQQGR